MIRTTKKTYEGSFVVSSQALLAAADQVIEASWNLTTAMRVGLRYRSPPNRLVHSLWLPAVPESHRSFSDDPFRRPLWLPATPAFEPFRSLSSRLLGAEREFLTRFAAVWLPASATSRPLSTVSLPGSTSFQPAWAPSMTAFLVPYGTLILSVAMRPGAKIGDATPFLPCSYPLFIFIVFSMLLSISM